MGAKRALTTNYFRRARRRAGFTSAELLALVALVALMGAGAARAQNDPDAARAAAPSSDLAKENFSYVAAPAVDIETVLRNSPGLVIEVKRWMAREATEKGQVVSDSDLTELSIRDRLRTDVKFRAVITQLLQHYGYLTPQLNPDSEAARERQLLLQERTKFLAQSEEISRERRQEALEQPAECDSESNVDCAPRAQKAGRRAGEHGPNMESAPAPSIPENPQAPATREGSPETWTSLPPSEIENNQPVTGPGAPDGRSPGSSASMYPPTDQGEDADANPRAAARRDNPSDFSAIPPLDGGASPADENAVYGTARRPPDEMAGGFPRSDGSSGPLGEFPKPRRNDANPPEMLRQPEPYADIPSLYDMYMQAAPRPKAPERFGIEVFEHRSENTQALPMDLPVGPEYVVGPGDGLAIDLWGGVSQRLVRGVDREGRLSLPEVGPILVSGKSLAEVQQTVQQVLRTQFRDVSADVSLARLRTVRVYVVGDVARPGAYDVSSLSTPLNALFLAGGPTTRGSLRLLDHYRGKELVQQVDVYDLLLHGVNGDIARLENGDTILVPPIGAGVTVEGMVRRPAVYELRDEKSLAEVLALAGGVLPGASLDHIEVQRLVEHEKRTMLSLDVSPLEPAAATAERLGSFAVQDGDSIRLFPIAPYNQDVVYLEGHVLRPGRYAYRPGMKLSDVIASFSDLMPEPSTKYAEIIRLNPPDYHPSVESFNLGDVLASRVAAPTLEPMDTVRIYGRYDFESVPMVSVWGEVRHPGSYRTAGQAHVSDALHLAGDLTPDALIGNAQIFRTTADSTLKIFSIDLREVLAGNPADNILLEPRDRILVHRNPAKVDPASVYVKGEIAKPGRYPLTSGMRVADLIRVGGGLRRSADSDIANLTEFRVGNSEQLVGDTRAIQISAALGGDPNSNVSLRDGETLTIRRISGWDDRGASISVQGEVEHPGTFGIAPGERLTSVLARAGGFRADAYPYGAVLERTEVREFEEGNQHSLTLRVQEEQQALAQLPETDINSKMAKAAALGQWQRTLDNLENNPPIGRLVVHLSANLRSWRNTSEDLTVRSGDVLMIPKAPNFVLVSGQVYNPTAVTYRPGKSAKWYLAQGGGPTHIADRKSIFVIRADGSVIGGHGGDSWWKGNALDAGLKPGDTVVVPEKALGGGPNWNYIFQAAQLTTSVISTAVIAARL
ncbi:MAG: SLBB domain-containing protein [Candidatus Acidiferrales bacterium]